MLRYAITDGRHGLEAEQNRLAERCAELARDGVEFILVREKHLAAGALAELSRRILAAVQGSGTRVLIARRVDVALAVAADGVHLAAAPGELTPTQVRRLMPGAYVSVSCHAFEEVRRARQAGASAVLFAPVFGKAVDGAEVADGAGIEALRQACAVAGGLPVFALGGVTRANSAACVEAGAAGVAGIRRFFPA